MLKVSSRLFPIGYIISVDAPNFNPHDFYVDGNWERIKGRVIVGVDEVQTEFNTVGKTGGAKTHTLSVNEMPSHRHKGALSGGSTGQPTRITNTAWTWNTQNQMNYGVMDMEGGDEPHNNLQPYQTAYIWKLISYSN
ncbi:MAG: hypothetical protein PHU05_04185 [Bacilli bacterium]|nr:hypothetical protein [Bacilli bacterium]